MASTGAIFQNALSPSPYPSKYSQNYTIFSLNPSQFLSSKSILKLKKQNLYSSIRIKQLKNPRIHASPLVYAAQSNFLKVIQTVWKVGKDGVEAGTNLVPDAVPRPIARISVTFVAVTLALFVLKSFLSTAFFALAVMGLSYFTFIALNKDDGTKGGGETTSVEDSLEEARKIMDKYK
ncbi:hypothetical protein PHJA_000443700 [Phtheirospermum japonicum]|uniref:Transmembrane protein n=1 Tax=Phtheirospermum japonicum TaxID=374723 RepID=A0A830B7L5_9LAMI|nr:hypothetical protein PHJA_000443700 [Phtheirospermum japonicum]